MNVSRSKVLYPSYSLGFAYHGRVSPKYRTQTNFTDHAYVNWYLLKGRVTIESDGRRLRSGPGDWVFFDPFARRGFHFSDRARIISIRFTLKMDDLSHLHPAFPPRAVDGSRHPSLLDAAKNLLAQQAPPCKSASETPAFSDHFRRKAAFLQWLAEWHTNREKHGVAPARPLDERILIALEVLDQSLERRTIDYGALCSRTALSRAQLKRVFKAGTGLTPKQWLNARTLMNVQEKLREQLLSLKEIAYSFGFRDPSHFSKWFRENCGMAPSEWRIREPV